MKAGPTPLLKESSRLRKIAMYGVIAIIIAGIVISIFYFSCPDRVHSVRQKVSKGMLETDVDKVMGCSDATGWNTPDETMSGESLSKFGGKVWVRRYYCKCFLHRLDGQNEVVIIFFDKPGGQVLDTEYVLTAIHH